MVVLHDFEGKIDVQSVLQSLKFGQDGVLLHVGTDRPHLMIGLTRHQ